MLGRRKLSSIRYITDKPIKFLIVTHNRPDHSYGNLVIHQLCRNILWVSDLAVNQRTTYHGDGDSAKILNAQDWLLQTFKNVRLMIHGHGHGRAQTSPPPMVAKTRYYVSRMRKTMEQSIDDSISLLDAVQNVEFEDWQAVPLYEINQRANANIVYR